MPRNSTAIDDATEPTSDQTPLEADPSLTTLAEHVAACTDRDSDPLLVAILHGLVDHTRDLQARVAALEDQPTVALPDETDPKSLTIGGIPFGNIIANKASDSELASNQEMVDELWELVHEDSPTAGPGTTAQREQMLPLHRMLVDMESDAGGRLRKSERRAASLYRRLVNKARGKRNQNVTPDGQKLVMTTQQAIEILSDEGHFDDLKQRSYHKTAGRVMRDVQRFTIVDDEGHQDCASIDECADHGVVTFEPGKPHRLVVSKAKLRAILKNLSAAQTDDEVDDTAETDGSALPTDAEPVNNRVIQDD